jgi:hypothetical protein
MPLECGSLSHVSVCGGGGGMGVVTGTATGCLIPPRGQSEAQLITALLGDIALVGDDVE